MCVCLNVCVAEEEWLCWSGSFSTVMSLWVSGSEWVKCVCVCVCGRELLISPSECSWLQMLVSACPDALCDGDQKAPIAEREAHQKWHHSLRDGDYVNWLFCSQCLFWICFRYNLLYWIEQGHYISHSYKSEEIVSQYFQCLSDSIVFEFSQGARMASGLVLLYFTIAVAFCLPCCCFF